MQLAGFLFGAFVELFLEGLYYRVKYYKSKNYLGFLVGFSHYVVVRVPSFIFVQVHTKRRKFVIFSGDRHLLTIFAVFLANLKVPNVYMGKGVKIVNRFYRQKKMLKKR
jgi:ribosomal protein L6P/L9E